MIKLLLGILLLYNITSNIDAESITKNPRLLYRSTIGLIILLNYRPRGSPNKG